MTRASGASPIPTEGRPDRLTVFAWLWACQALVHQEFYSSWLHQADPRGWIVTCLATATFLRPRSLVLFCGLLLSSIVYNVAKWPFVVNHILLESLINATILAAVASVYASRRGSGLSNSELREHVVSRFAPVMTAMVTVMYWFAFVAKLNADFVNPDVSCVTAMYGDLHRRFAFLPDTRVAHSVSIGLTLLVEGLIPLLLTFRRTRPVAVLIGLPFHFVLGLVGHRTFSGLAFAVYGLLALDQLTAFLQSACDVWQSRTTERQRTALSVMAVVAVTTAVAGLVSADLLGQFRSKLGPVAIYQVPWLIWIAWSFVIGGLLTFAIIRGWRTRTSPSGTAGSATPAWLWASVAVVVLLGLSPYLGLKTETCFTMYSNLRTEGKWNNHFFMPALKVGPWQTDLVKIVKTDHPALKSYIEHGDLMTYFELRRLVHQTPATQPFSITYERHGAVHVIERTDKGLSHSAGPDPHPEWLGRLLYFRPVSTDDCMPCRH